MAVGTGARRRPAVLVAALALGGVLAATLGLPGTPAEATSDDSVAQALAASENAAFLDEAELMPQMAITEAQAQQRLAEVAASRADHRLIGAFLEGLALEKLALPATVSADVAGAVGINSRRRRRRRHGIHGTANDQTCRQHDRQMADSL